MNARTSGGPVAGAGEASRVAIIGMGLIGGSLGLGLRLGRRAPAWMVVAFDRDRRRADQAVALGAADRAADTLEDAVRDASLVVAAVPAESVVPVLRQAARVAPPEAVFTDVASIKAPIVEALGSRLPEGQWFVGGHPMAGSERSGLAGADPFLFENAVYVLTPSPDVPSHAMERVKALVHALGAHVVCLSASEHDEAAAAASHLPHLVASCLVLGAARLAEHGVPVWTLAATGFRDATRMALGSEAVWWPILSMNRRGIALALAAFQQALDEASRAILEGDEASLRELLRRARELRGQLRLHLKGYGFPLWDVVVRVEDRPGAIHEVTAVLAREAVNIADIEILRAREGEAGTLRLGFDSEARMRQALKLLRDAGWAAWER